MSRRIGLIAGWLLATVVATIVSMTAVSLVGASVIDQPSSVFVTTTGPIEAGADDQALPEPPLSTAATTTPATDPEITTLSVPTTTETPTSTSVTSTAATSSTTTTTQPSTTTSTEATTTTTVPQTTGPFTFPVTGGTVTISCHVDDISLGGAVPAIGFTVEVEKSGPEEVRVDFSRDGEDEVEIRIECEEGVATIEVGD